ncbi:MAG: GNAT family N-acetyltransferase [Flavobacteriaceae bacterium]|nr:GNAT family N-acetyltransferase [Flavobacteriaceae bacterium]
MNPIFETENFRIRRLKSTDFEAFHEMQGNVNVMRFVRARPMTYEEDKIELEKLMRSYENPENDFWIFAVERKTDAAFIGTVALVKSAGHGVITDEDHLVLNIKEDECEIGYRLLEKYWGKGYASEIAKGLIAHTRKLGFKRLIGCVAPENKASAKILNHLGFQFVEDFVSDDLKIPEQKFELYL